MCRGNIGSRILAGLICGVSLALALSPQAMAQQKKWKDYRDPQKATITFDPKRDICISEKFIIWDMKGDSTRILKEEKDIAKEIIRIGTENKVDPAFLVAVLRTYSKYGRESVLAVVKSPFPVGATQDTPEAKIFTNPDSGRRLVKFDSWSAGIAASAQKFANSGQYLRDVLATEKPATVGIYCALIRKMQYIDTNMGWRYGWEEVWKNADEQFKKSGK